MSEKGRGAEEEKNTEGWHTEGKVTYDTAWGPACPSCTRQIEETPVFQSQLPGDSTRKKEEKREEKREEKIYVVSYVEREREGE